MKKSIFCLILPILFLFGMTGCKKSGYEEQLSDVRSDLFLAETEEFSLSLACISRETPYLTDGVAAEMSNLIEIVLQENGVHSEQYSVYLLGDKTTGGEMSYRSVQGDYYYSHGVDEFPTGTVSLRVQWGNETREISATSVKNENTLSVKEALDLSVEHEKETIDRLSRNGVFEGEFHVRLIRRDKNYYYVGIVTKDQTIALLLEADSGKVLARRVS